MTVDDPNAQRFTDTGARPGTTRPAWYPSKPTGGPRTRAAVRPPGGGPPLCWVWTDGHAAGVVTRPVSDTDSAEVNAAAAYARRVLAGQYARGVPASDVFDPALYAPMYQLDQPGTVPEGR